MSVHAPELEKFLTVAQVADWIGIHRTCVYKLIRENRIPCRRVPGTDRWVFKASELEKWMEEGR